MRFWVQSLWRKKRRWRFLATNERSWFCHGLLCVREKGGGGAPSFETGRRKERYRKIDFPVFVIRKQIYYFRWKIVEKKNCEEKEGKRGLVFEHCWQHSGIWQDLWQVLITVCVICPCFNRTEFLCLELLAMLYICFFSVMPHCCGFFKNLQITFSCIWWRGGEAEIKAVYQVMRI